VTAEQLHGADREQAWQQIVAAVPRFSGYQQKTDREAAAFVSRTASSHSASTAGARSASAPGAADGVTRPRRVVPGLGQHDG